MGRSVTDLDRRARQTRESILRAFAQLALERRYEAIRVIDLIAAADVGRATFYEHFRGKDEVLLKAMEPVLLLPLASAATGRASKSQVRSMLNHIWRQRSAGRAILNSSARNRLQRRLAAMIGARLEARAPDAAPAAMAAIGVAAAQLAMLRLWIAGEVSCSADALARQMIECSSLVGVRR